MRLPVPTEPASDLTGASAPAWEVAQRALFLLTDRPGGSERLRHLRRSQPAEASYAAWPAFLPPELLGALAATGITAPWTHQARAAELAWSGRSTVIATGTASGKSLGYLLPVLAAALHGGTSLYLSPTKALAADQAGKISRLGLARVAAGVCDGDSTAAERAWCRNYADLVLTNPDALHHSLLPAHERWARLFSRLRFVVVDECHCYRGIFGSHVALVLRRLQRIARRHGADPVFVLASATVADPARSAGRLVGLPVLAVTDSGAPRPPGLFALWEPPIVAGSRRSAGAETAELFADLVAGGVRTLAFVPSRRAAESVTLAARRRLGEGRGGNAGRIAAYRGGYLPEERRRLEGALRSGELVGLVTTSALELGVDVDGLDAVLMAGFPGTRASLLQRAGRAGRSTRGALAVLVARDDPLDTFLIGHPEALFDLPTEATVLDPDNAHVLGPHLAAAAAELPLSDADVTGFGPAAPTAMTGLVTAGLLRRRVAGWYYCAGRRPSELTDLRGAGPPGIVVVEALTGRVLGSADAGSAHTQLHPGAVYLHQGESYLVRDLDLPDRVALVDRAEVDFTTVATQVSDLRINAEQRSRGGDGATLSFGAVEVTRQVVSFTRRRLATGESLGSFPLELPERTLATQAVWWALEEATLDGLGIPEARRAGAAHAAEHAAIGLLPLFATCDRWDVGGLSVRHHPQTDGTTVFVYDGYAGGAGYAERGFEAGPAWLHASAGAIADCRCLDGCPACVQSPKCGSGNDPLDKTGASALLRRLVSALPVS